MLTGNALGSTFVLSLERQLGFAHMEMKVTSGLSVRRKPRMFTGKRRNSVGLEHRAWKEERLGLEIQVVITISSTKEVLSFQKPHNGLVRAFFQDSDSAGPLE